MKLKLGGLHAISLLLVLSCANSNSKNEPPTKAATENTVTSPGESQQRKLIGEWEQRYSYADKNGNNKLDAEEKTASNTRLGFDWFKFNADGSCLRDKEMKFKSTYEIQNKGESKNLVILNVHNFTITELTDKELILGSGGAFIVFKRIN